MKCMSPTHSALTAFDTSESFANSLDSVDPLADYRDQFHIPQRDGKPLIYLCGNSLGLQPKTTRAAVDEVLDVWAEFAVDAHFEGAHPWYPYHEFLRDAAARLVGAQPREVVMMNGLTVNLHLLMASFYHPTATRYKILMEHAAFPSDTYAARTQLAVNSFDPDKGLMIVSPRAGEHLIRDDDIIATLDEHGDSIALVLIGAVNYFTGQLFDLPRITQAAHDRGCVVGFDCAHAAGNIPLQLHDCGADFAAWCTYKYLNSGPGSVAGAFVHERHVKNVELPRFGGWWGNDPKTRFRMHLEPEFKPVESADAWQLSNPPILSMAAVRASLEVFDKVGIATLRKKSEQMTMYFDRLLAELPPGNVEITTPREIHRRGCQFSILAHQQPRELQRRLHAAGVVADFREPNVIRVAPVPLYNSFHDIWRFVQILREAAK
ncbi:MAG: kynureninase [Phycisphaerae bacterium]